MRNLMATWVVMAFLAAGCSDSGNTQSDAADTVQEDFTPECLAHSDCPDQNPCNPGVCLDGICGTQPAQGSCDDLNPCTVDDSCIQGQCVGLDKPCDNQLWCDGQETCDATTGECLPGEAPVEEDGIACTAEQCDEIGDKVLHTPDDQGCEDQNPCTVDYCDLAAGCLSVLKAGLSCDDNDLCTQDDVCDAKGACKGEAKTCGDGVYCNGIAYCDPLTGACDATETPLQMDDGIGCTLDACDEETGEITHTPSNELCDDANACTDNVCSVDAGGCVVVYTTGSCSDGLLCTVSDTCLAGDCIGTPKLCSDGLFCNGEETCEAATGECIAGELPLGDDGLQCTVDTCQEELGDFQHAPVDSACEDNDPCTIDTCDAEIGCDHQVEECQSTQCFYHPLCDVVPGDLCAEPTPLNTGLAFQFGDEFSGTFQISDQTNLFTPVCLDSGSDGDERWFLFSLAVGGKVTLNVSGNSTQLAYSLYAAPCQGDALACEFTDQDVLDGNLALEAGDYSLVVDAVDLQGEISISLALEPTP